jgi:hypothetical protein
MSGIDRGGSEGGITEVTGGGRDRPSLAVLASVIGGVAAVAGLASFVETTWLGMTLPAQVTLLTAVPLLAMVAVQVFADRPGQRALAALCAVLAVGGAWVAVFTIAALLDLPDSPLLLWPPVCVGAAVALSHRFVWLAAFSVVGSTIAVASISFVAAGAPWATVFQRWEPFLMTAAAWLVLGPRMAPLGQRWVVMIRRTALGQLLLALLVLSGLEGTSLLPYAPSTTLLVYQGATLAGLVSAAVWQRRLGDRIGVRMAGAALLVFLAGRYLDWRSDVVPAWLFFLAVALVSAWMVRRAALQQGRDS